MKVTTKKNIGLTFIWLSGMLVAMLLSGVLDLSMLSLAFIALGSIMLFYNGADIIDRLIKKEKDNGKTDI